MKGVIKKYPGLIFLIRLEMVIAPQVERVSVVNIH
jgi:hypothetical protein